NFQGGAGLDNAANLKPGFYTIVVTTIDNVGNNGFGRGCSDQVIVQVQNSPDQVLIRAPDITKTNSQDCNPAQNGTITVNDVFLNNASNGTGGYTFKLFNNAFADISGTYAFTGNVVSSLPSGTYYVQATSTSGSGCTSNFRQVIITDVSVKPTLTITQNRPNTFCDPASFDGRLTVAVTNNDGGNYTYQWFKGAINDVSNPVATVGPVAGGSNQQVGLEDGMYWVRVTDNTTTGLNCAATAAFNLQYVPVVITLQASSTDDTSCDVENGSVFFNGTTDFITITSSGNPADNATVNTTANIDANYTLRLYNASFSLHGAGVFTTAALAAEPLAPGRYYVTATHKTFLCASEFYPVDIEDAREMPELESSTITADINCTGDNGTITFGLKTGASNTGQTYGLTWTYQTTLSAAASAFVPGSISGDGNSGTEFVVSDLAAGFYTVIVENTASGCETTERFQVTQNLVTPAFTVAALTHSTLCTTPAGNGSFELRSNKITNGVQDLQAYTWRLYQSNKTTQIGANLDVSGSTTVYNHTRTLGPGEYYIQATRNSTGCPSAFIKLTIEDHHVNPSLTAVVTEDQGCVGGTLGVGAITITLAAQDTDGDATTDGTTITWANTAGALPAFNGLTSITGLSADTYTVTIVNNVSTCQVSQQIVVGTQSLPVVVTARTTTDQTNCTPNGAASVDVVTLGGAASALADYNFTWKDVDNATTLVNNVAGQNSISNLSAGAYTVTLTHAVTGCAQTLEFVVEEEITYPVADITLVQVDQSCDPSTANGELSVIVDDPSAVGYDINNYVITWYEGSGVTGTNLGNTQSISGLAAGPYTVEVLNNLTGCTSTAEITLENVPVIPQLLFDDIEVLPMTVCDPADGSIEINGITPGVLADYTFELWNVNPATAGASPIATAADTIFTDLEAGIYYIRAVDNAFGCSSIEVEVEVEDASTPPVISLVNVEVQTNCNPAIPNGLLEVTANGSNDTNAYTFAWYRGTTATGTPLLTNNPVLSGIAAGMYTVLVTDLATGCSSVETYPMTDESINPLEVTTTATVNDRCIAPFDGVVAANLITLPFGKEIQDYRFLWRAGLVAPGFNAGEFDFEGQSWENLNSGTYTLMVYNIDDPLCQSQPIQVVVPDATTIPDVIVAETQALTICFEDQPNGELSAILADSTVTGHTFEWYTGTLVDPAAKIFDGPVVGNLAAGPYTLRVTNTITGCQSTQTVEVTDQTVTPSNPTLTLVSNMTSCAAPNGEARATVEGNIGNYQFDWYEATDTTTIIHTGFDPKGLGREGETVEYIVIATDLLTGCVSEESRISISDARTEPQFVVDVQDSQCLVPTGVALLVFPEPIELDSVVWTHLATGNTTFEGGLFEATFGDYSVTIWDGNGCTATQEFTIGADIVIYNGVSANGDGLNDLFIMDCIDQFPNNNVKIFNRAGAIVWEGDSYDNTDIYFDGVSNKGIVAGSRLLPAGTYFYLVDKGDGTDPLSGYLELIR
ncbi:MAG: gliding motility-associated C-terminal domain-containing protein, partial [Imperialibacter sp.]|uniref:gliding motility-associated C-terminal domain-containing protein n=1 Tax=Imperialibacter sp. TaxID=2038411 RepID=UPI0032EB35FB